MRHLFGTTKVGIAALIGRFGRDQRGQIAIIFGLSITMLVVGAGASVDLARSYIARQKLSQVAELTCQYSVRPSVVDLSNTSYSGTNGLQAYLAAVNGFAGKALSSQNWGSTAVTDPNNTVNYFSATAALGVNTSTTGTAPTNPVVEMKASIPTMFMQIVKVPTIAVHAKINCLTASNTPQIDNTPGPSNSTNYILQEGFERPCASFCFTKPDGTSGTTSTPTSATPSSPSYYSTNGQPWYILGYCLETDITGQINGTSPEGTHTAELDCDNGSGNAGNSSISAKFYLAPGSYELRYNYRSRLDYQNYDPTYICGTTSNDVAWANDATPSGAVRTNQINVYLDMATTSNIPLHTTIDGSQQLGGSNLIDVCVYSPTWIERSVKISVMTPAYYWLSFAADGTSDSYGGQLDNIRLCQKICTATLQDNFPPTWMAVNNGGLNKVLFEDSFEKPVYSQDSSTTIPHSKSGNLVNSTGVTAYSSCYGYMVQPGWPCQSSTATSPSWASGYTQGWGTGPVNEIVMNIQGAYQGSQYPALVGSNTFSSGNPSRNRAISRPFVLDPGYYQVSYDYISGVDFSGIGTYGTYCYNAPGSGYIFASSYGNQTGTIRFSSTTTADPTTNIVGVFMANGQLISTPVNSGATLGSATQYTNPDGTITSTPISPPDSVNWQSYDATASNPVLDVCGYADSFRWLQRSVSIKITKPGIYWLTFSANGDLSSNGNGGGIDDVKITALGSPFMTSAPTTALVPIPVPAPQPDSLYYGLNSAYNGFTIIADPFQPPSAN